MSAAVLCLCVVLFLIHTHTHKDHRSNHVEQDRLPPCGEPSCETVVESARGDREETDCLTDWDRWFSFTYKSVHA
jgi:hypothetical protein